MKGEDNKKVVDTSMEPLKSASLSLSSSSSSSVSPLKAATEEEVAFDTGETGVQLSSLLPPRSPAPTKTHQHKREPKSSTYATRQERSNIDEGVNEKSSEYSSFNEGKVANNCLDHADDNQVQGEHSSNKKSVSKSKQAVPQHKRKVSWGGKLITIPGSYNDINMPKILPERPTNDHSDIGDNNNKDTESNISARTKAAKEIVSAIETTMKNESIDNSMIISSKRENHRRDESGISSIQLDDLTRMHPIESEAAIEILKAIESQDRRHHESHVHNDEQIETVASLFKPADTRLLENVPEGAEEIFQSRNRSTSHISSVTDNSVKTNMSETMIGSSNSKIDSSQARGVRGRLDSATQYSTSSTIGDVTRHTNASNVGHQRTNTMASYQTIVTVAKSPRKQANHNYDYRRGRHRRQETMEERLFSLNQALDAVDLPKPAERSVSGGENPEPKYEQQEISGYHHAPSASLDLFNQNLAQLFQSVGKPSGFEQERFDENEMIPLATNQSGVSVPRPPVINRLTSSTSRRSEKKESIPETEDASLDDGSKSAQYSAKYSIQSGENLKGESLKDVSATKSQRHQQDGLPLKVNGDVEMGTSPVSSKSSTKAFASSSGNSGKMGWTRFSRFMNKIGLIHDMEYFLKYRSPSIWRYLKNLFWLLVIAISFSAILFYGLKNPLTVYDGELNQPVQNTTCRYVSEPKTMPENAASYSWWILFLLVRLPITYTIARSLEIVLIQFLILECRWVGSCMGSTFTLLVVQAKGWPAIMFFWSICNMVLLYGNSQFANHWGYWQDYIELFNHCNPSGTIIASSMNLKIQLIALVVSVVVAIKRLLIGFYQGRKTFLHYAEELSTLMTKILLISEISHLSSHLELNHEEDDDLSDSDDGSIIGQHLNNLSKDRRSSILGIDNATQMIKRDIDDEEGADMDVSQAGSSLKTYSTYKTNATRNKLLISDRDKAFVTGLLSQSQKRRIERLLGNWEEPENEKILTENVSIGAILQFRKSLSKLQSEFPFSYAFGKADTRDHCIESSQNLYLRLLELSPDETFHFNILGSIALQPDGSLDHEKLKSLIKVFRPDRDGILSLNDFVKSMDLVYKEMKLLWASVRSSQKIDKSFEKIFNILFYFAIACMILGVLGYDPIAVFLSLSSIVLAFSFMISRASSKYVEGLLFILYRRPYDIGDCIVIQPIDEPTSWDGSTEWIVRDIDLFTTTVVHVYTHEMATLSNGSIANSRVINGARSLPAIIYVTLRFGVDTSFEKLEIFREALSQYVEKRPREWAKLLRITNVNVQADQGFVEYLVVLQHVNNWQQIESIVTSRSQAKYFCHELSKQLDIRYKSPSLPVDLRFDKSLDRMDQSKSGDDPLSTARMSAESDQIRNLIRDRRM